MLPLSTTVRSGVAVTSPSSGVAEGVIVAPFSAVAVAVAPGTVVPSSGGCGVGLAVTVAESSGVPDVGEGRGVVVGGRAVAEARGVRVGVAVVTGVPTGPGS